MYGVCKGNGSVHADLRSKSYFISLGCMGSDFAEKFRQCLEKIAGRRVKIYRCSNGEYLVSMRSKMLYEFLKSDPTWLAEVFPNEFVRGFADSEGSASVVRRKTRSGGTYIYPKVSMSNNNLKLLLEVKKLLAGLEIEAGVYLSKKEGGKRKPNYTLDIVKKKSVHKFIKLIGFSIARKLDVPKNYFQTSE